jgi:hypothetical protein
MSASKVWTRHEDKVLSFLCDSLVNRKLSRAELKKTAFSNERIAELKKLLKQNLSFTDNESDYLIRTGELQNYTYSSMDEKIKIMKKNGDILDIADASDIFDLNALSRTVKKYFLTYPKQLDSVGLSGN